MKRNYGLLHTSFLGAIGVAGWAAVLGLTFLPLDATIPLRPFALTWTLFLCFLMAALARLLAVRVFARVRIALDSAFYISAAFILGLVPAAWLVLLIFTADALVRFLSGSGVLQRGVAPKLHIVAHVLNNGGLPAFVLLLLGLAFGIDELGAAPDRQIAILEPGFAVSFLVTHYLLAGGAHWFQGVDRRALWREFFLKVVVAELSLVPLALAMVLGYMHQGAELYVLLGATCLMFNVIFRQSKLAGEKLAARVLELSTLDKVSRVLSSTLERRPLLSNLATETLKLVRHTSRLMVGLVDEKTDEVLYELFDESGKAYRTLSAPRDQGLSGWVMLHKEPLLLGDVQRQFRRYAKNDTYNDPKFHSWLGVPLVIYDEVMGVMSVQTEQENAYTVDHLRVLANIADQAAVAIENSRLYELATVDGLTSLLVRRHFEQRLEEEWHRASRYDSFFSLGIFDLDNFKSLNDTFGHQTGDQVLRAAAGVVRRNMRGADLAGRYGGEEFAFILPRTRLAEALTVAERIRADVERLQLEAGGRALRITASIGLAEYPGSGADVAALINRADAAMYEAKRLGKNRVCTSASDKIVSEEVAARRERGVV